MSATVMNVARVPVRNVRVCSRRGRARVVAAASEQERTASALGAKAFGLRNATRAPTEPMPYDFPDIFAVSPEEYLNMTLEKFPDEGICDVQQARVLFSVEGGYQFLDVRATVELDDGKVAGAFHCPLIEAKKRWDSEKQEKVMVQTANPKFVEQVKARFPDKEQKLVIACSDSRDRAIQVLQILDNEGYSNIVGLRGGCNEWCNTFDNKLGRRRKDGYQEIATAEGTTGIFGTRPGAGWQVEGGIFSQGGLGRDTTEWIDWAEAVGYEFAEGEGDE